MNPEIEVWKWLATNWPSVVTGLVVAAVYIRLSRFVNRLTAAEKILEAMRELHVDKHPEDWKKLYKGHDE